MAKASLKKQAAYNTQLLNRLHSISLIINSSVILGHFLIGRPHGIKVWFFLTLPSIFVQYWLEKAGRPVKNVQGQPIKSGEDLRAAGLTQLLLDLLYITWVVDILFILVDSNYVWWLMGILPGIAYLLTKVL